MLPYGTLRYRMLPDPHMLNDHCHRVSTHLQSINIIIIIIIIII